ncbi:MAG: cyclase family protein [Clostridiales bacterium]|nr:cyclase family protein [Clostridiales bacterium]
MKIIDLTTALFVGMPITPAPGHYKGFDLERTADFENDGKVVSKYTVGTHTGTHTDSPTHFIPNSITIDQVPLDSLIGPAVLVDMSHVGSGGEVTAKDLEQAASDIKPGDILVIRTDWSKHWDKGDYFKGRPCLSEDAAYWIVNHKIKAIGVDMSGVDPTSQYGVSPKLGGSPIHKILLGNGILITEYLCNLDQISEKRFFIVIMPVKITGAEAAQSRVAAIEGLL